MWTGAKTVKFQTDRYISRKREYADLQAHTLGGPNQVVSASASPSWVSRSAIGPTSPRDPYDDDDTCILRLPLPKILTSASGSTARPGSCRKPPGALYIQSGMEWMVSFRAYRRRCERPHQIFSNAPPRGRRGCDYSPSRVIRTAPPTPFQPRSSGIDNG
jgi:hypothetical protein